MLKFAKRVNQMKNLGKYGHLEFGKFNISNFIKKNFFPGGMEGYYLYPFSLCFPYFFFIVDILNLWQVEIHPDFTSVILEKFLPITLEAK